MTNHTPEFALGYRQLMLKGLAGEMEITKKVIAAVPDAASSYKPDPCARTARELAWHLANTDIQFLDGIADQIELTNRIQHTRRRQSGIVRANQGQKVTILQQSNRVQKAGACGCAVWKGVCPDHIPLQIGS